jgi:hypothetical protein
MSGQIHFQFLYIYFLISFHVEHFTISITLFRDLILVTCVQSPLAKDIKCRSRVCSKYSCASRFGGFIFNLCFVLFISNLMLHELFCR